jgi:hypothetical protein
MFSEFDKVDVFDKNDNKYSSIEMTIDELLNSKDF